MLGSSVWRMPRIALTRAISASTSFSTVLHLFSTDMFRLFAYDLCKSRIRETLSKNSRLFIGGLFLLVLMEINVKDFRFLNFHHLVMERSWRHYIVNVFFGLRGR